MVEEKQSGRGREAALALALGAMIPLHSGGLVREELPRVSVCALVCVCMCKRAEGPHVLQGAELYTRAREEKRHQFPSPYLY